MEDIKFDKFYITEILNDLHRNGFVDGGKACQMLREWSAELREKSRTTMAASHLKRDFNRIVGKANW